MGQLTTKTYSLSSVWDSSVNGSGTFFDMGVNIKGGSQRYLSVSYTVILPLVTQFGIETNVNAGPIWNAGTGMVDPLHTIAVLNAGIGFWFNGIAPAVAKFPPIGSTANCDIAFRTAAAGDPLVSGRILFTWLIIENTI